MWNFFKRKENAFQKLIEQNRVEAAYREAVLVLDE
jgi:hypothetical protein